MAMNLGRAGFYGWAGVMLLSAAGCGVETGDPGDVASVQQASEHSDCLDLCEIHYQYHYYVCQTTNPGSAFGFSSCYEAARRAAADCIRTCPPPGPPDFGPETTPHPNPEPWPPDAPLPEDPPQVPPGTPDDESDAGVPVPVPCRDQMSGYCYASCDRGFDWEVAACVDQCFFTYCGNG